MANIPKAVETEFKASLDADIVRWKRAIEEHLAQLKKAKKK